jgi:uncharacterized protein
MLKYIFIRVILPVLLFLLLRYVFKSISGSLRTVNAPDDRAKVPHTRSGGELRKDPVCGTYVPADTAVTREVDGQVLHFCSAACRDKYRA